MAKKSNQLDAAVAALREVILAGEQYRIAAARHLDLTISESQAVSYLMARGPMGQTELGDALGFNTSSTTALVDRLERSTIAERTPHPTDRRRSIVQLSESGRRDVAEVRSWMCSAFDQINPAELPAMTAELQLIADNLHTRAAQALADKPKRTKSRRP